MTKVLFFAYGHNMSSSGLRRQASKAIPIAVGFVEGHSLTFDWASEQEAAGKCHAEPTGEAENRVYGVIWELIEAEKTLLDLAEGLGRECAEKEIAVRTHDGEQTAKMYFALNKRTNGRPRLAYKQRVLEGAREHNLPPEYCAQIEQTACHDEAAAIILEAPSDAQVADAPLSVKARYWETPANMWNLSRVPKLALDVQGKPIPDENGQPTPHPGRTCAVFVVHGVGRRQASETSAGLRSGFEDALEAIKAWQATDPAGKAPPADAQIIGLEQIPPPFVFDGFWSDYQNGEATFPNEWAQFTEREKPFFNYLWRERASVAGAFFWFWRQQARLFGRTFWKGVEESYQGKVGSWKYLVVALFIYLPLQLVGTAGLLFTLIRFKSVYQNFLLDVRMYLAPKGFAEYAIVENIDRRVGKLFMKLIGLDLDFLPLPDWARIDAGGGRIEFSRVVWVAHSLGTVISYKVLGRLFHSAIELEASGSEEQKKGVKKFRAALHRFVTMGSPLDKIAFLFPEYFQEKRGWPTDRPRREFVVGGERDVGQSPDEAEWWINFYHVLDPVSGPIQNPLLYGDTRPNNYHLQPKVNWIVDFLLPGYAHMEYWTDMRTLRYILGRTFGRKFLFDQQYHPMSDYWKTVMAAGGYCFWAVVMLAGLIGLGYGVYHWRDVLAHL